MNDAAEFLVLVVFALVFGSVMLFVFLFLNTPGSGSHVGFITATETTGLFWSTHTAYIKTDLESSQEEAYCVTDTNVLAQLKQASIEKTRVVVYFSNGWFVPAWTCNGEQSIIQSVEAVT